MSISGEKPLPEVHETKRSTLSGLVVVAIFSSALCHGCMRTTADPVPAEELDSTAEGISVSERTGQAQEPVTADECWAAYKAGESVCRGMPPDAAMGCFLAIRAILAACLASAR